MTGSVLVGDVGGTHARLARADATGIHDALKLRNDDHASMTALVQAWQDQTGSTLPRRAALAVAGPISGDRVAWTNRPWSFSASTLRDTLGLDHLRVLNDFEAVAWALPELEPADLVHLGGPDRGMAGAPMSALGPGTGLGVAMLVRSAVTAIAVSTEGGHVALAPVGHAETALVQASFGEGRIAAEPVLCGRGLARLYTTLARQRGLLAEEPAPEAVTAAAVRGDDPVAAEAVDHFLRMLGRYAGDVALLHGARGGVFLVGSILGSLAPLLAASDLRAAFEDKAAMRSYVTDIPLWWVTEPEPALLGAAAALGIRRHPGHPR